MTELRLRVAKCLGWQYQQDAPEGYGCIENGDHAGWWRNPENGFWLCAKCQDYNMPEWSSDWGAAGELLEVIVSEGASFSLIYYQNIGKWNCEIFTNLRMRNADATTGPAAISEAFCAWKEASNE